MKAIFREYLKELREDFCEVVKDYRARQKCKEALNKVEQLPKSVNFPDYLPYRKFNVKHSVFENANTIGFIVRVSHFSGMTASSRQALISLITNDIPPSYTVQLINYASPRIGDLIDYWRRSCERKDIFEKIANERSKFFKTAGWKGIRRDTTRSITLRDFELYICISRTRAITESGREECMYELDILKEKLIQGLRGINSDAVVLNDRELADFLQEIIIPDGKVYKNRNIDHKEDIRGYFCANHEVEMHKDKVTFTCCDGNFSYLVFEVTGWPEVWRLENSVDYIGQFETGTSLPCPFYITYGFKLEGRESSERNADRQRMIKTKQGDSKLPMFFPKMIEEIEDWRYVSARLNAGERLGKAVMYIVLCAGGTQEEKLEQIAGDHFARLKFQIEKVRYDTLNTFLYTLPFGISENWQLLEQLKVPSRMLSGSCINLMPVFADIANYGSSLMMFVARRGQITFFDNYKTADNNNDNFNIVVVGKPGTGKSVWLQEYAASTLRFGGQVVILDDGRSFENSTMLLGGDFVNFGGGDFCINPFSLYRSMETQENDNEYKEYFEEPFIDLIVSILCIIVNLDRNNTSDPETGLYRAIMHDAVHEVMHKKGRGGGFKDIREELLNNPKLRTSQTKYIADRVAYILSSYSEGRYARYFNGKATLNISNILTVFEFSDLEHNEILQNAVLLMVVFLVYAKMRSRERRTSLIIDEAWRLLRHPAMKGFIGGIARRARKYRGCLVVATQSISDFDKSQSEAASAVLAQSTWRVIFSVDGKDEEILKKNLGMSDGEIAIAQGLTGVKGVYSEFMLRYGNKSWQVARLLLDKFSAKLYSSTAEDVVAIRNMKKQGIKLEEAIEKLARLK